MAPIGTAGLKRESRNPSCIIYANRLGGVGSAFKMWRGSRDAHARKQCTRAPTFLQRDSVFAAGVRSARDELERCDAPGARRWTGANPAGERQQGEFRTMASVDPKVFRTYDIRALVPELVDETSEYYGKVGAADAYQAPLTPEGVEQIGRGLADFFGEERVVI